MGNVRHVHSDGNDTATPHGDLGGYSYSAFGKLLRGSDPGALSGGVPLFGWQGKRVLSTLQPNLYDSRARVWSADLGAFLQPDEYVFLTHSGTLWSWPGQNPFRWRDPSGRDAAQWFLNNTSWIDDVAPALAAAGAASEVPGVAQAGEAALLAISAIDALSSVEAQRQSAAAIAKATSTDEKKCSDAKPADPAEKNGWKPGPNDIDWRGTGQGVNDALNEAFGRTGVPKEDFEVTQWGRDANGKSFPTEWRAPGGAEVNVDEGHDSYGPGVDHVGWQTPGSRSSGGAQRGHILLDDVPYNR